MRKQVWFEVLTQREKLNCTELIELIVFFETMPLQEIRTVPHILGENDGPVFIAKDRKSGLTWEWPWLHGASSQC